MAVVRASVWLIGFGVRGVRKNTLASNLIKNQRGRVPAGSFLALLQSIGAGGFGARRGFSVFLFGAVMFPVVVFIAYVKNRMACICCRLSIKVVVRQARRRGWALLVADTVAER
jgi:Interferon-induced 6-16 family